MGHSAAAQVPNRTADQKAQVGPQLSTGLPHHRRGPTQRGPQRAGPGHPAEAPCQPQAWPTRHAAKQQPAAPQGNAQRGATGTVSGTSGATVLEAPIMPPALLMVMGPTI